VGVPPRGAQEVVLFDQLSRVLDQPAEDRECLRRERHDVAIVQEPLVGEVERIAVEAEKPIRIHRRRGELLSHCVLTAI
jgi:hypothetical protein